MKSIPIPTTTDEVDRISDDIQLIDVIIDTMSTNNNHKKLNFKWYNERIGYLLLV